MSERALALAARRNALRAHCEIQRMELADTTQHIEERLGRIDHGIAVVRRYARQPLLMVGGLGVIALVGPRRLLRWFGRSAFLMASGQRVLRMIRSHAR